MNTMKAVRFHAHGGPEVLKLEELPIPQPAAGETLVRVNVAGLNYSDIYQRQGLTKVALPFAPGAEGVGTVERDSASFRRGTRVAWVSHPGAFAEFAAVPDWKLVPLPDALDDTRAAAALFQGMTAEYLCHATFDVQRGHDVLVHAGAGGAGQMLIQMLKHKGARVFTTVSTPAKAGLAREAGADEVIVYTEADFAEVVKAGTGGRGAHVVYDSVGRATFDRSLACVRPLGTLVLFGQSSGPVPPVDPMALSRQGSVALVRPTLAHYIPDGPSLQARAGKVLRWLADGLLRVHVHARYPLQALAQAQADLESRRTSGKLLVDLRP
jgi:NADPH2:quinone reductase